MISNLSNVDFENTFNQIDILLSSANGVFDDIESGEGGTLSLLLSDDSLYNNLNKTAFDLDTVESIVALDTMKSNYWLMDALEELLRSSFLSLKKLSHAY